MGDGASFLRVLVTGANGFVGRSLCRAMLDRGWAVRAAVRTMDDRFPHGAEPAIVGGIDSGTDWRPLLGDIDAVVHLAARVHVMRDSAPDPLAEFRTANVDATMALARQAAAASVPRFLFLSTIKVLGEGRKTAYTEADSEAPQDPYAISKQEAEHALLRLADGTGMSVTILRPPLVYGPGVGGNFIRLIRLAGSGWPLPFGAVSNRRSLVYVGNLADASCRALERPAGDRRIFLVSDGEDVSTPELIRRIAMQENRTPRLVGLPLSVLRLAARLTGRAGEMERLTDSLYVDSTLIRTALGWAPPFSLNEGLSETIRWARNDVACSRALPLPPPA